MTARRDEVGDASVGGGTLATWSGAGLVVASTVGAGVMLSTGFMAQVMGPGPILLAWTIGSFIALTGVWSYGAIAASIWRSGGEYRYLSDLVHPWLGYLSGWGSLILGFSMPIAVDALAIGAFAETLAPVSAPRITAVVVIVALTIGQTLRRRWAVSIQNVLVLLKVLFLLAFVAVGVVFGSHSLPAWQPPGGTGLFPWKELLANQFWIAFAFSGWNAAIYASGDFADPRRQIPRAMLLGCGAVVLLYLAINALFVVNLTPDAARAVFEYEQKRITLAHVVSEQALGPWAGRVVSVLVIACFLSAMTSMMLVGPRVYAEMAKDGFLPRPFAAHRSGTPSFSVIAQSGVALLLVLTHSLLGAVQAAAAFLMAFTGLTAISVLRLRTARLSQRVAGAVHATAMAGLLIMGVQGVPWTVWASVGSAVLIATVAFCLTRDSTHASAETSGTGAAGDR